MGKGKKPPEGPGDIPAWVMTFSDVITLLMTFFILLLTFSSMEPEEHRDMMQTILPGSDGVAGATPSSPKDAVLFRQRSHAGRITDRGSEVPPVKTAPTESAMGEGLAGLKQDEMRELSSTHTLRFPWSELVDGNGKLTSVGKQRLRMLAFQAYRQDFIIRMRIGSVTKFDPAMEVYLHMVGDLGTSPSDIGVGRDELADRDYLYVDIIKRFESTTHGS